jgi:alkylhydroperoxidase family enzyme
VLRVEASRRLGKLGIIESLGAARNSFLRDSSLAVAAHPHKRNRYRELGGNLTNQIDVCRFGKWMALLATLMVIAGSLSLLAQTAPFSPRLSTPRIAPVPVNERTEAQRQMLASRPDFNIYKTLAHNPELYARWSPLGGFLLNGSSLPARHREIVMLRMGWLCQSEYEWAQHARIATSTAGLTEPELHRIAAGPGAAGWTGFERTLLRMVDELRYDAMISDATWKALRLEYNEQQIMEALFTAAQYQLVSMALNSLGVQLDPGLQYRLPRDTPMPRVAAASKATRLKTPRIAPLRREDWTAEQREMIAPQIEPDGSVMNTYATILRHPRIYTPRATFGLYLRRESSLPPKAREMLIMRTAHLIGTQYEWHHHLEGARAAGLTDRDIARIAEGPNAAGWSEEDRALLRAADDLRREAFITTPVWIALAKSYTQGN